MVFMEYLVNAMLIHGIPLYICAMDSRSTLVSAMEYVEYPCKSVWYSWHFILVCHGIHGIPLLMYYGIHGILYLCAMDSWDTLISAMEFMESWHFILVCYGIHGIPLILYYGIHGILCLCVM